MAMLWWPRNMSVTVSTGWWHAMVAVWVVVMRRHGARRLVGGRTPWLGTIMATRAVAVGGVVALVWLALASGWVFDHYAAGRVPASRRWTCLRGVSARSAVWPRSRGGVGRLNVVLVDLSPAFRAGRAGEAVARGSRRVDGSAS